ncbi:TPA: hypothetical protein JW546_003992 [Escherichia coli]|nr:hypothetical protein [Escherichia coli]
MKIENSKPSYVDKTKKKDKGNIYEISGGAFVNFRRAHISLPFEANSIEGAKQKAYMYAANNDYLDFFITKIVKVTGAVRCKPRIITFEY